MFTQHRNLADPRNVLLPDIACSITNRQITRQGSIPEMPNLVVEVKATNNSLKRLRRRVWIYLDNGTQIVWLVLQKRKMVEVYTADEEWVLGEGDLLDGGAVLPGFTLPVEAIFVDTAAE